MSRRLCVALLAATAVWSAAARDDAEIIAAVRKAQATLRDNIRSQNWLGVADYSPPDRVEVGVNPDGSAMGGFKGGAAEAAVFANFIGATIPRTVPGEYQWHDDTFAAFVESERLVHVVGYGHASGDIACSLFHLPDHKGFSTYSRYRLDLDGRWRIQITLFPIGDSVAQFRMSGGLPPSRHCPSPPKSPLFGNAPMLPGTQQLMRAVRPTSDEQGGFSQTTGFGIGTAEDSLRAQRTVALRSLALSEALRNGTFPHAAKKFFSKTAALVPESADRFVGVDDLLARSLAAQVTPMRTTWAFDEQDGVVHEVGLGGFAASYYTRWELLEGELKVTVHVFPVGPPPSSANVRTTSNLTGQAAGLLEVTASATKAQLLAILSVSILLSAGVLWSLGRKKRCEHCASTAADFVQLN